MFNKMYKINSNDAKFRETNAFFPALKYLFYGDDWLKGQQHFLLSLTEKNRNY